MPSRHRDVPREVGFVCASVRAHFLFNGNVVWISMSTTKAISLNKIIFFLCFRILISPNKNCAENVHAAMFLCKFRGDIRSLLQFRHFSIVFSFLLCGGRCDWICWTYVNASVVVLIPYPKRYFVDYCVAHTERTDLTSKLLIAIIQQPASRRWKKSPKPSNSSRLNWHHRIPDVNPFVFMQNWWNNWWEWSVE